MENNEKFDTSEVLTDEDYALINNIKTIKRNLFSFINMDLFVSNVSEIIDNSELVSFKNERAKKYIDKKRPIFLLTVDREKSMKENNITKFNSEEEEARFFSNIIQDEVITKITDILKQSIDDIKKEDSDKIFNVNIFDSDDKTTNNMLNSTINKLSVISTLYGIRLEKNSKNNVVLELLL